MVWIIYTGQVFTPSAWTMSCKTSITFYLLLRAIKSVVNYPERVTFSAVAALMGLIVFNSKNTLQLHRKLNQIHFDWRKKIPKRKYFILFCHRGDPLCITTSFFPEPLVPSIGQLWKHSTRLICWADHDRRGGATNSPGPACGAMSMRRVMWGIWI